MKYQVCGICKEWGFDDTHKCPPVFRVRDVEYDPQDWIDVRASDAEQAAERYCSRVDSSNYEANSHDVFVKSPDGTYQAFSVDMDMVPNYYAHKPYKEIEIVPEVVEDEETESEE